MLGDRIESYLCADCAEVLSDLERTRPDLKPVYLSVEDIRSCLLSVCDNADHEVDRDKSARIAKTNKHRFATAILAFEQHRELAVRATGNFRISGPRGDKMTALDCIRVSFRERLAELDLDGEHEILALLQWLIGEGERLCRCTA